jgi:transposase
MYPSNWQLVHDNDGRHHSLVMQQVLEGGGVGAVVNWPANSPDLNPIENLWNWLKNTVAEDLPNTQEELRAALTKAWGSISSTFVRGYIESMPRRLAEVIAHKGNRTRY